MAKRGLGNIPQPEFKIKKKPDMSKPKTVEPKISEKTVRTMPDDKVLIHYNGRLGSKFTPKSVQLQQDAHTALKMISVAENKPMRETVNDMIEKYINDMPESEKKLIMPQIRASQTNMPEL